MRYLIGKHKIQVEVGHYILEHVTFVILVIKLSVSFTKCVNCNYLCWMFVKWLINIFYKKNYFICSCCHLARIGWQMIFYRPPTFSRINTFQQWLINGLHHQRAWSSVRYIMKAFLCYHNVCDSDIPKAKFVIVNFFIYEWSYSAQLKCVFWWKISRYFELSSRQKMLWDQYYKTTFAIIELP